MSRLNDMNIMPQIKAYIETYCEWENLQKSLIQYWKHDVDNSHILLMDANCYEPYTRLPTDVKLLWECFRCVFESQLLSICSELAIKNPRCQNPGSKNLPTWPIPEKGKTALWKLLYIFSTKEMVSFREFWTKTKEQDLI